MTPPVLLTAPTNPFDVDACPKRSLALPPFGVLARPSTSASFVFATLQSTSADLNIECDAYEPSDASPRATRMDAHRARQRQWTGAPIRAIIPLPRRASHNVASALPCLTRTARVRCQNDVDSDSGDEIKAEAGGSAVDVDVDGDEETSGSRYCSYESITAAEGLAAWSFEELRAECYAQSFVARGTKPPPVTQPALAIPPAFVPRIVSQSS